MLNDNGKGARLDSWKDIASYLRRDVRTAIRWEKDKGLPVRRVRGGQRKAVFAYASELDAWLMQEGPEPHGLEPDSVPTFYGAPGGHILSKPGEALSVPTALEAAPVPGLPFASGPPSGGWFLTGAVGSHSIGSYRPMELKIEFEREDDGHWIAEIPELPGVMAYGATMGEAEAAVEALALRVIADRIESAKVGQKIISFA